MRRKSTGLLIANTTGDIRRDLTCAQLASIGAVAMAWNSVESFLDGALLAGLGLPARLGERLIARINAFDAKAELLKSVPTTRFGLSEPQCESLMKCLETILAGVKDLKEYRDAVIHCQPIDVSEAVGLLVKRDSQYDVLLSQAALDGLYDRLVIVRDELRIVCLIFLILGEALKNDAHADLKTLLHRPAIQEHVSQAQEHRKARLSLPPLPKFPPKRQVFAGKAIR